MWGTIKKNVITFTVLHVLYLMLEHFHYHFCVRPYWGVFSHPNAVCTETRRVSNDISKTVTNALVLFVSTLVELTTANLGNYG